jgi:periplasmic protein TonB
VGVKCNFSEPNQANYLKTATILILTFLSWTLHGQEKRSKNYKTVDIETTGRGQIGQNGDRTDIWEFYTENNKIEFKFDYSRNLLIYEKSLLDTSTFKIFDNGSSFRTKLDQPPLFKEGSKSIEKMIVKNIKYPMHAARNGIEGKVIVGLLIDSIGNCIDRKIVLSVDSSCDNEALRVAKLIPSNWYPAIYKGKKVTAEQILPINFRLAE